MHPEEEELRGGNSSSAVVRSGGTVRKSVSRSTPAVFAFMRHLRDHGVDLPEPQGRDDEGRQVLEFVPGALAQGGPSLTEPDLSRVGALVRAIHDNSEHFAPPADAQWHSAIPAPGAELICHNDLAPWNLIVGERWVFIDWDAAGPSTRLWDLAYAAQAFTLSEPHRGPQEASRRLRAFVDGYGACQSLRSALPDALVERTAAMVHLLRTSAETGFEPWASMSHDGHGEHWKRVLDFVQRHHSVWSRAVLAPAEG